MSKRADSILPTTSEEIQSNDQENILLLGGTLIVFNIVLMLCVSFYWTNTAVHQYFSGKPLWDMVWLEPRYKFIIKR